MNISLTFKKFTCATLIKGFIIYCDTKKKNKQCNSLSKSQYTPSIPNYLSISKKVNVPS